MANVIRHKTSQPTKRGLRRGDTVVGTGEENYGPTSTTGYVNGITPPDGGYVVYTLGIGDNPAIYVANNDTDLINIAKTIAGQNFHPFPTDIFRWVTAGNNSNYSRDSIESPVGNTPLLMSVTGNDPYTNSYNSSTWNMTAAKAGETWQVSCWVKASEPCDGHFFIFGTNDAGSYSAVNDYGANTFDIETEWQRFSFSRTFTNAAVTQIQVRLDGPDNGGSGIDVHWDGLQVERSSDVSYFRDNSSNISNISEAKAYLASIKDVWILDSVPQNNITDGLVLSLNASQLSSYPELGSTWYDSSGNNFDYNIIGSPSYSDGAFTLTETTGFKASHNITNSTTATVVVFYKTTDGQELWATGQSNSYYIAASYGNNYYSSNAGSPSYYVDTTSISNPSSYRDGKYHMWEAKNVNLSTWTRMWFWQYGSSWNMNGTVAKIMVYDRALTAEESQQNYYGGPIVTDGLKLNIDVGNLVSYESGSTTWYDMVNSNYSASLVGNVGYSTTYGGTLNVAGSQTSDYIILPHQVLDNDISSNGAWSLECWLRMDDTNGTTYFFSTATTAGGSNGYIIQKSSGTIFPWNESVQNGSAISFTAGETFHLTLTISGGSAYLYKNGTYVGRYSYGRDITGAYAWVLNQEQDGTLSGFDASQATDMGINIIRVYNKTLSDSEVLQNFNAQKARFGL